MGDLFVAAGADRIVSLDLHTGQIQGFVDKPFDHLTALHLFATYLKKTTEGRTTMVSPDSGRVKLASRYAAHLGARVAFVHKRRAADVRNESSTLWVVGDVKDRNAIIVDDMIDTGGTVSGAAELLKQRGALSIRALASHGVLSPPAVERIAAAPIDELIITNSLPLPEDAKDLGKITVLSVGPILAGAVSAIFADASVSDIFQGENI
jgi:ribose-phosphate pyrophosphokinase